MEEMLSPEDIAFLENSVLLECFSKTGKNTEYDIPSSCFFCEDLHIGKSRFFKLLLPYWLVDYHAVVEIEPIFRSPEDLIYYYDWFYLSHLTQKKPDKECLTLKCEVFNNSFQFVLNVNQVKIPSGKVKQFPPMKLKVTLIRNGSTCYCFTIPDLYVAGHKYETGASIIDQHKDTICWLRWFRLEDCN